MKCAHKPDLQKLTIPPLIFPGLFKFSLILKAPTADDVFFFFFVFFFFLFIFLLFSEKTSLDISCESSVFSEKKLNVICYKFCFAL